MRDHVDAEQVRRLIQQGTVEVAPATVSAMAEAHLKRSFPLHTKTTTWVVDWDALPSTSIPWADAPDDEVVAWAAQTQAGRCTFGLLLYTSDQPCLLGKIDVMIKHLDELIWAAPGNRFLFGVERSLDGEIEFGSGVIEIAGGSLRGSLSRTKRPGQPWES